MIDNKSQDRRILLGICISIGWKIPILLPPKNTNVYRYRSPISRYNNNSNQLYFVKHIYINKNNTGRLIRNQCLRKLSKKLWKFVKEIRDGGSVLFLPIPIPQKISILTDTDTVFFSPSHTDIDINTPKNTDIYRYRSPISKRDLWGKVTLKPLICWKPQKKSRYLVKSDP